MTEQEWVDCTDPTPMLEFLWGKTSDRKLRLFACACCRRIWHLVKDERSRNAIEIAEQYAEDLATAHDLQTAGQAAKEATWELKDEQDARCAAKPVLQTLLAAEAAEMAAWITTEQSDVWGANGGYSAWEAARLEGGGDWQCALLRDTFGSLLFRPVTVEQSWRKPQVIALARAIYDERAFERMPTLADALEESGCDNAEILNHCRQPGEHVRGCWVLDLVLGKE